MDKMMKAVVLTKTTKSLRMPVVTSTFWTTEAYRAKLAE